MAVRFDPKIAEHLREIANRIAPIIVDSENVPSPQSSVLPHPASSDFDISIYIEAFEKWERDAYSSSRTNKENYNLADNYLDAIPNGSVLDNRRFQAVVNEIGIHPHSGHFISCLGNTRSNCNAKTIDIIITEKLDYIGEFNAGNTWVISGKNGVEPAELGGGLGYGMSGGKIDVYGSIECSNRSENVAEMLRGGKINISGDVHGSIGHKMADGEVAVNGTLKGAHAGHCMTGGKIFVKSANFSYIGCGMKNGKIVVEDGGEIGEVMGGYVLLKKSGLAVRMPPYDNLNLIERMKKEWKYKRSECLNGRSND